jgi:hypothetical protein
LTSLPERIDRLTGAARGRADRLLDVRAGVGHTVPPAELEPWLRSTFGSVEAVREQPLVKVTNLVTLEATLFAPLRARRPVDGTDRSSTLADDVAGTEGDPFCHPETGTPADTFGRVRGRHVVTGANAAMADVHHAVLVFDRHDPLDVDVELVSDVLATGRSWAERARRHDAEAANYVLIWNCLWRAGGSIVHGHAQALLGAGPHYARIERFRRDAASYTAIHRASLVEDLVALHRDLDLAIPHSDEITLFAHITPMKEREVLVVGRPEGDERDPGFAEAVARALVGLRDGLGTRSFNLALWRPPLTDDGPARGWEGLGPIVRIVDRGDLASRASDIGSMELYGTPIVGTDPWEVAAALR